MRIDVPWLPKIGGLLGSALIRRWMATLDYRVSAYDPVLDPAAPECNVQKLFLFWHEYILFPIYLRSHCNIAMLLSQHRDAEVLSHIAHHLGFDFVRGSTNRGGAAALRAMLAKSRLRHLTITPDGPRGPRRRLAPGAVYLASKLGMPLVLTGYGFDRPWRARSWDRFAVPRPFSRARCVLAPEIRVPAGLSRLELDDYRLEFERQLTRLTEDAEQWAASGRRRADERSVQPAAAALPARALGVVEREGLRIRD